MVSLQFRPRILVTVCIPGHQARSRKAELVEQRIVVEYLIADDIDLVDLHGDWSNGGFKYFQHWAVNVANKKLHGGFVRITNVTGVKGGPLLCETRQEMRDSSRAHREANGEASADTGTSE